MNDIVAIPKFELEILVIQFDFLDIVLVTIFLELFSDDPFLDHLSEYLSLSQRMHLPDGLIAYLNDLSLEDVDGYAISALV